MVPQSWSPTRAEAAGSASTLPILLTHPGSSPSADVAAEPGIFPDDSPAASPAGAPDAGFAEEPADLFADALAPEPPDVPTLIVEVSERWGLDPQRMLRVAWCESRYEAGARGPGGASGVFQIVPQTWQWASAGAGFGGLSPFDPRANVETAAWLMATHGPTEWACR